MTTVLKKRKKKDTNHELYEKRLIVKKGKYVKEIADEHMKQLE